MRNRHKYSHKELLREKQQMDEFEKLLEHVKSEIQRKKEIDFEACVKKEGSLVMMPV